MPVAVGVNDKRRLILIRDGDDEHEEDGHDCVRGWRGDQKVEHGLLVMLFAAAVVMSFLSTTGHDGT